MKRLFTVSVFCSFFFQLAGQDLIEKINLAGIELQQLEAQKQVVYEKLEFLKLEKIIADLEAVGLPQLQAGDQRVKHHALILDYAPEYKQARWVAHIIVPDIIRGVVFRTNDFRVDPDVHSGTAVESDYFLTKSLPDSSISYDGFGYDRGHLAPSADFRWSKTALSESYFYSNISPQTPEFNRESWAALEDAVRGYIYRNPNTQLYVLSGPILEKDLPVIERGKHKLPIPNYFWKVVLDKTNKRAIGFLMPNRKTENVLKSYALSVDELEKRTGLDFFTALPNDVENEIESQMDPKDWLPAEDLRNVDPLKQVSLPKNHFNTTVARQYMNDNREITVCGTVVGARVSRAGNILINLDKAFPNQVFTVFIKKQDIINFSYAPEMELEGKLIYVKGKVINQGGVPTMYIKNEEALDIQ